MSQKRASKKSGPRENQQHTFVRIRSPKPAAGWKRNLENNLVHEGFARSEARRLVLSPRSDGAIDFDLRRLDGADHAIEVRHRPKDHPGHPFVISAQGREHSVRGRKGEPPRHGVFEAEIGAVKEHARMAATVDCKFEILQGMFSQRRFHQAVNIIVMTGDALAFLPYFSARLKPVSHSMQDHNLVPQCLAMAFAQLAYRESLRDIEACLGAVGPNLYHMGFGSAVARSTLADVNESRDWRIFADFAQVLIRTAIKLYANDPTGIADVHELYALDSTTIDLCLSMFPWARFRKHKAAVKMHTLLDLHGSICLGLAVDIRFLFAYNC